MRDAYYANRGLEYLKILHGKSDLPSFYNERVLNIYDFPFWKKSGSESKVEVNLDKVVGTSHQDYYGKTWLEMFGALKHFSENAMQNFREDGYFWNKCVCLDDNPISFYKYGEKYFIMSGNNRTCTAKFLGLKTVIANISHYIPDEELTQAYEVLEKEGYRILVSSRDSFPENPASMRPQKNSDSQWLITPPNKTPSYLNSIRLDDREQILQYIRAMNEFYEGIRQQKSYGFISKLFKKPTPAKFYELNYHDYRLGKIVKI